MTDEEELVVPFTSGRAVADAGIRGRGRRLLTAAAGTLIWLLAPGPASGQAESAAVNGSTPSPLTEPRSVIPSTPPEVRVTCPPRPRNGLDEASNVVVTLDPDTLWRPQGSEVRFTVTGKGEALTSVGRVEVCMGWAMPAGGLPAPRHDLVPAPVVRAIRTDSGGAFFGAVVPKLPTAPTPWWPPRLLGGTDVAYTAVDTVPVADMVVRLTVDGGPPVTVLVPVGVTSLSHALVVLAMGAAASILLARRLASRSDVPGSNTFLKLISSPDGFASLSQFQILLWTVTVATSAVYVMVLSGNLITISPGTLTLLGVAGAAALAARLPSGGGRKSRGTNPEPPAWSDLIVVDGTVDLTRVQMLLFTLISALFVLLKVIVGYIIPDVPVEFVLLMGISNGIYVAGRRLPEQRDAA